MQKAIMIFESLIYIIIGAIGGRAILHDDLVTLILAIILFVIIFIVFALVYNICSEEEDDTGRLNKFQNSKKVDRNLKKFYNSDIK